MTTEGVPIRDYGLPGVLARLDDQGIDALIITDLGDIDYLTAEDMPQIGLLDMSSVPDVESQELVQRCSEINLPVIALVAEEQLSDLDLTPDIHDFVLTPPNPEEIVARAKRITSQRQPEEPDDVIRMGELVINPTTYEVALRGRRVNLRFKEYELLKLLITNPGRVYTREALLSHIWGYDYLGGTRTVDVHIRRLRSKIEDADNQFIETIWNVGYRFRDLRSAS